MYSTDAGPAGPSTALAPIGRLLSLLAVLVLAAGCSGGADTVELGGNNFPPVANAGAGEAVFEGSTVSLNGSGSDADGDPLSFSWSQISGPMATLSGAGSAAASFVAPDVPVSQPATLIFELRVSDGQLSDTDTVIYTVEENVPPVASAGPNQSVADLSQVTLDGSASSDANSIGQLTFAWTQLGGPAVTLAGANTSMPTFTAPDSGGTPLQLSFQLTVSDGVFSATDSVIVTVSDDPGANFPPVADAGPDQVVAEGSNVALAGSGFDANGDPLTYAWVQTGGPAVTLSGANTAAPVFVAPDVTAANPQTLTFELTVSDGMASDTDSVSVRVEENLAPIADAGPDQTVTERTTVTLDGSASTDPDATAPLTYAWVQIGGAAAVLSGANTANPTFTAPEVVATEMLLFELTVSDGSLTDTDTVIVTVEDSGDSVTVSGRVNYEFVPPNSGCAGLDFNATIVRPIRQATVELLDDASNAVLASTVADDQGNYSFAGIDPSIDVRLRVRAEIKRTGSPSWDVEVRDNTGDVAQPLPARPLYVMDGPAFTTTAGGTTTQNLTATTGWGGSGYTGDRTAAPFAVLDAIYSGMRLVLAGDAGAVFEPLDAFWSVNNTGIDGNIDVGEIGTSYYTSDPDGGSPNPSLFLLGDANSDTEEFDDHVVVHEWGHYFEDTFARSDSIGGAHMLGDALDARVAFGEGFATALAAMALAEPQYCDTGAAGSAAGFGIDAENAGFGMPGWYNEISVVTLLYDLWDAAVDGTDTGSLGFAPIYMTMVGPQASTPAFTSIFSFAADLRDMLNPADQNFLDSQLSRENIQPVTIDIWGSTETNDANHPDVLPVYTSLVANGSVVNVCTTSDFEAMSGGVPSRTGNKLSEHRFLRLTVPTNGFYDILVETSPTPPVTPSTTDRDQSDPDIYIYRDGLIVAWGNGSADNVEDFRTQSALQSGVNYAVDLEEWRFSDTDAAPDSYPSEICFDVSATFSP